MQLAYTILYVDDVPASLAFYEAAFGLSRRYLHEEGDWGELDTGGTRLSFCSRRMLAQMGKTAQRPDVHKPSFEIAFTTQDVEKTVKQATASGATLLQKPEQMPWGQTVAYVADPEGFWVEICTPMELGG